MSAPGGAHGDGERATVDPDLQGLLGGEGVGALAADAVAQPYHLAANCQATHGFQRLR